MMVLVSNVRASAAKILAAVIGEQKSLSQLLQPKILEKFSQQDASLLKQYCYGVLRWFHRLRAVADILLHKPLKSNEHEVAALLYLGLYQLIYLRTPSYAAVSETVQAALALKKIWAKGLLNGLLRQFLRNSEAILAQADQLEVARFSHPQWLIDAIKTAWPSEWQTILTANNEQGPLFLRVNNQILSTEQYQIILNNHNITAHHDPLWPCATLCLEKPLSVEMLPDFNEGACSIQDLAGQFVAELLDLHPDQRILDACAAPGSKTAHILEIQPDLASVIAIDQDSLRLSLVKDNIRRLKLADKNLRMIVAEAEQVSSWWDGELFDRILLDAPCSGAGVIRRHPDIKILRKFSDIQSYQNNQILLLNSLWPLLKPQGLLLYTTCSILPQENSRVMEIFCKENSDAKPLPVSLKLGSSQSIGCQLLPVLSSHDGFYFGLLQKVVTKSL